MLPTSGGEDGTSPILVPKGMSVLYSAYCIQRRPDIYGMDAEMFRPERWNEEPLCSRDAIHRGWTFLPFGGGPRTCLGSMLMTALSREISANIICSSGFLTDRRCVCDRAHLAALSVHQAPSRGAGTGNRPGESDSHDIPQASAWLQDRSRQEVGKEHFI